MCTSSVRCALALWAALALVSSAAAYTVDCNHEYTDCESELGKSNVDEEVTLKKTLEETTTSVEMTSTPLPTRSTSMFPEVHNDKLLETNAADTKDVDSKLTDYLKPNPRLLDLNDDLQFANVLNNDTHKGVADLSDVNLDEDEEVLKTVVVEPKHNKKIADKFFNNLQAPFHTLLGMDKSEEEVDICKENKIIYKIGERMDRGCEETCECMPGGVFECSSRCKHPYIRSSRRLNDPLCYVSPVDECCSILTCANNGEARPERLDMCIYGNDTYALGAKWNVGCEKVCTCEKHAVVFCKPRCDPIPQSDKCINVQDPNDFCCEVQVCDVSQDAHEEPMDNSTSSTSTTTSPRPVLTSSSTSTTVVDYTSAYKEVIMAKPTLRPLVLIEPIGSIKVLQNNSVQVNLMHPNSSQDPIHLQLSDDGGKTFKDVMLKYSNLILNLPGGKEYILKTKETDTKFNFTITTAEEQTDNENTTVTKASEEDSNGCYQDGEFYPVGEEFHVGCSMLCECTGNNKRECVALECPSHVGLELLSKGCVKWAPSPPAEPPNCCPRVARCLSDGTCHFKDVAIPNWSEVPISLSGCEQRCFCENGELDCQEVCTPLSAVPPQTFRCPPKHHPAHVNVSDEDCCKQWGCIPNEDIEDSASEHSVASTFDKSLLSYSKPVAALLPTTTTSELPLPPNITDSTNFYKHLSPVKSIHKFLKSAPVSVIYDKHSFQRHKNNKTLSYFSPSESLDSSDQILTLEGNKDEIKHVKITNQNVSKMQTEEDSKNVTENNMVNVVPWNKSWKTINNVMHVTHSPDYYVLHKPKQLKSNLKDVHSSHFKTSLSSDNMMLDLPAKKILFEKPNSSIATSIQAYKLPSGTWPNLLDISSRKNNGEKSEYLRFGKYMDAISEPNKQNLLELYFEKTTPDSSFGEKEAADWDLLAKKSETSSSRNIASAYDFSQDSSDNNINQKQTKDIIITINDNTNRAPNSRAKEMQSRYFVALPYRQKNSYFSHEQVLFRPQINNSFLETHTNPSNLVKYSNSIHQNRGHQQLHHGTPIGKFVTVMHNKEPMTKTLPVQVDTPLWAQGKDNHVLTKAPNPYETVLLRPQPNLRVELTPKIFTHYAPSTLQLDNFLNQIELEAEANRNIERSARKKSVTNFAPMAGLDTLPVGGQSPHQTFLPTVLPDHGFNPDELPKYEPPHTLLPELPQLTTPNYGENNKKLTVLNLQADSPTSVKMLFGLPPVLVGLRGNVDLRYTDKADEDISTWSSQVFAPADEILTTSRLEFRLTGLKPSTMYKIRAKLYLHNLPVEPESDVFSIRTKDLPMIVPIEEKRKEIDSRLTVVEVNDTAALVSWRHFTEDELEYIDGIQVRYRPVGTPIYLMTELLHHSRSSSLLQGLHAGSKYEASLILIPPPRSSVELQDPARVEFTTAPIVDPYNWNVTIEARAIGSEAGEVTWRGVPAPAEQWVRVYRAVHACLDEPRDTHDVRRESDAFRLAARDLPPVVTLTGLKPNTRCRVWLELFLTNGKVKTSNVLEITTKSLDSPIENPAVVSAMPGSRSSARGDYYGALVSVGVVAALGALTSLLLLLVVVRRHRPRSVPITPVPTAPRESSLPPYDNPAYKLELQQETMDL